MQQPVMSSSPAISDLQTITAPGEFTGQPPETTLRWHIAVLYLRSQYGREDLERAVPEAVGFLQGDFRKRPRIRGRRTRQRRRTSTTRGEQAGRATRQKAPFYKWGTVLRALQFLGAREEDVYFAIELYDKMVGKYKVRGKPEKVSTVGDLIDGVMKLREDCSDTRWRVMAERSWVRLSDGRRQGGYSASRLCEMVHPDPKTGAYRIPTEDLFRAFLRACECSDRDIDAWLEALQRVNSQGPA
ncbi:hypothetical protein [Nocardiopsis rhodophaea]|uniref:hypothetical protein n=1 Tax=Nocardiopsis rhodophaea TaxID=280238 RepID=UPI0031DF09D7